MELLKAEPGLIFWTVVTFVLLLVILRKFAWGPILAALEARENAIQKTIDDAERLHAEAQQMMAEHEARLAEAREERSKILDAARQAGEQVRTDVLEKARGEAEQIVERAQRQLALETEHAIQNLRAEAADLALKAAEKVIARSLNDDDHRRFASEAVNELTGGRT
jgi:F-type H+-transporting ATPase subunit b